MTWTLTEPFDDPHGRWDQWAPWDATEASDSVKGFLTTQQHTDVRCFRVFGNIDPAPQFPHIDLPVQQTVLDAETQTQMETQLAANDASENWVQTGTGFAAYTIGAMANRGGWSGLQAVTTGVAVSTSFTSALPSHPIDISLGTNLSVIFPDYQTFDATSYIQLTSDPNGVFGNGFDSAQVLFSSNIAAMPELRLAISGFAHAGFDNTKVTGVLIHLNVASAPALGQTMTIMGMRALASGWGISWLDFDTRIGAICRPITLNGLVTTGTVAQNFQFVRGDGSKNDPIPADLAVGMYFYPGGSTSPNDATGASVNYLAFILREQKNTSAGTGSHIEAGLQFNDAGTTFVCKHVSTTGGSPGTETDTGTTTISVGGPLDPSKHYLFRVQLKGTTIIPTIWQVDTSRNVIGLVWQNPTSITNSAYAYGNGRVGFIGSLLSRDAYIEYIDVEPTGFAELETVAYTSRTPVDGAQLAAVFSDDMNLFTSMSGTTMVFDSTKTISGDGSYRATGSLNTNSFNVDDWTQMYLSLAIWVSNSVTQANQPKILLNTGSSDLTIPMTALKPAQWNNLYFDLGIFRNLISSSQYSFIIQPGANPDKPLGFYWVDSMLIGRRRVSWSVRTSSSGLWREFKNMVNDPNGAIHFTPEERGTALQLKADALTQDAWVGSFHLFPRYAQLGLPVYDQGGTYEVFDAKQ